MRIGFDVCQTGKTKAGCGFFADGLIRSLAGIDQKNEYILYPAVGDIFWDPECGTSTFSCELPNFGQMRPPRNFDESREFWSRPGADFEKRIGAPEIVHANSFYCPSGLSRARLVYTLYDLSFLQDPSWTTEANRTGCLAGVFQASLRADLIVAISEYSRDHFLETFPHYPKERVKVIYPASRFAPRAGKTRPSRFDNLEPGQFWLSVGTIEPRKNHGRLLDAYRLLKKERATGGPLVLAGGKGWLMDGFKASLHGLDPEKDIISTGYVSDEELAWLYANCRALVYPSLFEGFGMPVLEALGLGAPVICSHSSSLPEVGGEAALYFDPLNPETIAAAMRKLASGEVDRNQLKAAAAKQAARFSWEGSARQLQNAYQEVMDLPRYAASGAGLAAAAR